MAFTAEMARFHLDANDAAGIKGRRVLITGAGRDGGFGQALALAAGLGGAATVGVHFHRSYQDALDLVEALRGEGVRAIPVQADVTSPGELWASRDQIVEGLGGPPEVVICNSGLAEQGYGFGRPVRDVDGESAEHRQARAHRDFVDNLEQSRAVLDTKLAGFLGMTHLWASEAILHQQPTRIIYISSRQALDPGAAVPGYVLANFAALALPETVRVNLGAHSSLISTYAVCYPFLRTNMTQKYAENLKVFGRWQPRMLETYEGSTAFMALLARPSEDTDGGIFELSVGGTPDRIELEWDRVEFSQRRHRL